MARRVHAHRSEEFEAIERVLLYLTAAVGAQAALIAAINRDPLVIIGLPAVAMIVLLARGSVPSSGYPAALVWALLLPHAPEEALIVPIVMAIACLAIAVTPERLMAWVRTDFGGRPSDRPVAADGWIEDDPRD